MTEYLLYTKPNCPWCDKIKELLYGELLDWTEIDVTHSIENLAELKKLYPEAKTVPQLFIKMGEETTKIGGYEESKKHFSGD